MGPISSHESLKTENVADGSVRGLGFEDEPRKQVPCLLPVPRHDLVAEETQVGLTQPLLSPV